jgi:DNA-directed RNA polymerase subunit RPC12/RpoP
MTNFLPNKVRFAHKYCFFLHDILADIIVSGEALGIFSANFKFRNEGDSKAMNGKSGEDLFRWLQQNGYNDIADSLVVKRVFVALLSDFCHFVYEALQNSKKAKLTVAYALLRKPFKDNLLYFEWLLADPKNFLDTFFSGNIRALATSTSFLPEKKIQIIRDAMDKTAMKQWIDPEYVYQLRFDKQAEFSLEHLWQRANHLITTFGPLETEEMNFNFVFSNKEDMDAQWTYLYYTLPILLFHAHEVVLSLLATFADPVFAKDDFTEMRVTIGFLLCMEDEEMQRRLSAIARDTKEALSAVQLHCPKCQRRVSYSKNTLRHVYLYAAIKCPHCGLRIPFGM